MDIEQYIRDLPWSERATTDEKTLVEGNLRTLYAAMQDAAKPLLRAAIDIELEIDEQAGDELRGLSEAQDLRDSHAFSVCLQLGQFRALTRAINATYWAHEAAHDAWDRTKLGLDATGPELK